LPLHSASVLSTSHALAPAGLAYAFWAQPANFAKLPELLRRK
jgi:hypothetical protein